MNSNTGLLNLITMSFLFSCSLSPTKEKKENEEGNMHHRKLWWIFAAKKVKCWKSSERVGNEINSSTVLVGNLPHVMPCLL